MEDRHHIKYTRIRLLSSQNRKIPRKNPLPPCPPARTTHRISLHGQPHLSRICASSPHETAAQCPQLNPDLKFSSRTCERIAHATKYDFKAKPAGGEFKNAMNPPLGADGENQSRRNAHAEQKRRPKPTSGSSPGNQLTMLRSCTRRSGRRGQSTPDADRNICRPADRRCTRSSSRRKLSVF